KLTMERVDEAVRRVLAVKARRGLFGRRPPLEPAMVGNPHHLRIAREIAERAITVVSARPGALPIAADARVAVISGSDEFVTGMQLARGAAAEIHLPTHPDPATRARVIAAG